MTESDKSKEIVTIFIGDFIGEFNELTNEMALKFKDISEKVLELMKTYKISKVLIRMKVEKQ